MKICYDFFFLLTHLFAALVALRRSGTQRMGKFTKYNYILEQKRHSKSKIQNLPKFNQ